jgi:hypothetical protein
MGNKMIYTVYIHIYIFKGWMENTVLFYGAYHNKTAYLITGDAFTYNMSLAYLCAVGLTFMLSFILLVKK